MEHLKTSIRVAPPLLFWALASRPAPFFVIRKGGAAMGNFPRLPVKRRGPAIVFSLVLLIAALAFLVFYLLFTLF